MTGAVDVLALFRGRAMDEEPRVQHTCNMGVGCEESGVCYAVAHGEPDRCGRAEVSTENLKRIAASGSMTAKTNALVNAANEIDRLRAALARCKGGAA